MKKIRFGEKFNLDKEIFTIIHVGHLIPQRNLQYLKKLTDEYQVIIVVSKYLSKKLDLYQELQDSGCLIFEGYYPNIQQFYQCSDCYIFPVKPGNSIACPLSILEAMACNLPIITTPFEGLNQFIRDSNYIKFIYNEENINEIVTQIKQQNGISDTRDLVKEFSWETIANIIASEYHNIY